jgi:amiloride-sensitive sodium channel
MIQLRSLLTIFSEKMYVFLLRVHHKNYHRANYSFDDFNGDAGFVKSAGVVTYPLRALMSGADNSLEVYFEINTITDVDYACNSFIQGFSVRRILH